MTRHGDRARGGEGVKGLGERVSGLSPRKQELLARQLGRAISARERQAVAVVGIGCRFPGGASDPESYWRLLRDGTNAVGEIPPDRWPVDRYFDPRPAIPGKMSSRWGGFLDGVDRFDADFFGIAPREARSMDPQQRLVLEVSWEALEDAGLSGRVSGTDCGVFLGVSRTDYAELHRVLKEPERLDAYFGTGNAASFLAGRVSYALGLQGPSLAVDTACSSSLVAIHAAVQSLRSGECDLALAGGVNLILSPAVSIYLSQLRTFSPGGRCKAFDAGADGYVRGEGCGVVVLKREADAARDRDRVYALIRGSAVNQDGRSSGLTVPSRRAQAEVIRRALAAAAIDPGSVGFLEAHGTGTPLGDPIELEAIADALELRSTPAGSAAGRGARREPLAIGSVKTNLGHLEAAAGVAGLVKLALALRHGEIPPQLHFRAGNPDLDWGSLGIEVATRTRVWNPRGGRRVGGVSSFGFSGTNAHVILEEAPAAAVPSSRPAAAEGATHALALSAVNDAALRALAASYAARLEGTHPRELADVCYSAGARRAHQPCRLAVVGRTPDALRGGLEAYARRGEADDDSAACVHTGTARRDRTPGVVFVFSGQGSLWPGMARDLLASEPVFRRSIERCDAEMRAPLGGSILEALSADGGGTSLGRALEKGDLVASQAAVFAIQTALAALWGHWGVVPSAVVGHSLGELAAARAAGCLSLEEAALVVCARSRLLSRKGRTAADAGRAGLMVAVRTGVEELTDTLRAYEGRVWIGAENSPVWTVLSGESTAVSEVVRGLEARGVACRGLATDGVAGHCPLVEEAAVELERDLAGLAPSGDASMMSSVHGRRLRAAELGAGYWKENLRRPVRFRQAFQELLSEGHDVFLEIGPHPILGGAMAECLQGSAKASAKPATPPAILASLRRDADARGQLLGTLGALYARGLDLDWEEVYPGGRFVDLPRYAWQRERYWIEGGEPERAPRLLTRAEVADDPSLAARVAGLIEEWGREGCTAINLERLAPQIFVGSSSESIFFVGRRGASLVALLYVGPDAAFAALVEELRSFARAGGLRLSLLATEASLEPLAAAGFRTTRCGVLQELPELEAFTLGGRRMRRLRYLVDRFRGGGSGAVACSTTECRPSEEPALAAEVRSVVASWTAPRPGGDELARFLERRLIVEPLGRDLRVFVTRRDEEVTHVVTLSRAPARGGYLLDLEFYRDDSPLGGLEFTIVNVIETLVAEGSSYLSLGGTFGTALERHENEDPEAARTLEFLHRQGILNGDGNFRFKSKFRPRTTGMYLCQPAGEGGDVADVLRFLAGEKPAEEIRDPTSSLPAGGLRAARSSMLGERLQLAGDDAIFESVLDGELLAILRDHRLTGRILVPGAWFMALALAAVEAATDGGSATPRKLEIRDFEIRRPMILEEALHQRLQVVVGGPRAGGLRVRIFGRAGSGAAEPWTLHATAGIGESPAVTAGTDVDIGALAARLERRRPAELYDELADMGVEYGGLFRGIRELWSGAGEALARVELAAETGDAGVPAHPALLDCCLQVFAALGRPETEGGSGGEGAAARETLVVRGVGALRLLERLPASIWCHARAADDSRGARGSLAIYSPAGRLLALAEAVTAGAFGESSSRLHRSGRPGWAYEISWRECASAPGGELPDAGPRAVRWLVLDPGGETGPLLQAGLRAAGFAATLAVGGRPRAGAADGCVSLDFERPGRLEELFERLAGSAPGADWRVVSLGGPAPAHGAGQPAATYRRLRGELRLVQALHRSALGESARLSIVTSGARSVLGEAAVPREAPLWGLAQVFSLESSASWGGIVDLEPGSSPARAANDLVAALLLEDEDLVAARAGRLYVPRLRPAPPGEARRFDADPDKVYLVSGGYGGLGLFASAWLVERGARHLALFGRRPPGAEAEERIRAMEGRGATVACLRADVASRRDVARIFATIERSGRGLAGVLHAAGVLSDGLVSSQDWGAFRRALEPKVRGAWNLHLACRELRLDHFVLFSSLASVLGSPGQGSHAAGNAYLDALAHLRRAQGLPAISVNWGPWEETGKAAGSAVLTRLARRGVAAIRPAEAGEMMNALMGDAGGATQVAVAHVDWQTWRQADGGRRQPSMLSELMPSPPKGESRPSSLSRPSRSGEALEETLAAAPPEERERILVRHLRHRVGRALGRPAAEIGLDAGLDRLGLDSLMVVEIREGLEADLGVSVPLVELFGDPSVVELAALVLERLPRDGREIGPANGPSPEADAARTLDERVEGLTDDEIEVILDHLQESADGEREEDRGHGDKAAVSS